MWLPLIIYFITTFCISFEATFDWLYIFQVSDTMLQLRQRNTYPGNSLPPWMKPKANFEVHDDLPGVLLDSSLAQESGSTVIEIIKGSRLRAHAMVDAASQVWMV